MDQMLVDAIKKHAMENYEKAYGWSEIIECFSDQEIHDEFIAANRWEPEAKTSQEAITRAESYVELKEERYREAVGPDIDRPECGTRFPENTCCPKCR